MTRLKIVNAGRTTKQYTAEIELDGNIVARVERGWSQGGFRANDYRAIAEGIVIATGRTLADLREELRAHFAHEYPDARESW